MSSSLIGCPIHSALCRIEAKSFVNYISKQIFKLAKKSSWHLWRSPGDVFLTIWAERDVHILSKLLHATFNCTLNWRQRTLEACNLELLLTFLFHIWDKIIANPKMLFFYLSGNVIFITRRFVVLDLLSLILFRKTERYTHIIWVCARARVRVCAYIYIYIYMKILW